MKLVPRLTIYFLLISLIPLVILATVFYNSAKQIREQTTLDHLSTVTDLKSNDLKRWINDSRLSIEELAQRPLVKEYSNVLITTKAGSAAYSQIHEKLLNEHFVPRLRYGGFNAIFLINPADGQILASTNTWEEGIYRDNNAYFTEGKKTSYVEGVYYSQTEEKSAITIGTPVRDRSGNLAAVLAGNLDLSELSKIMESPPDINKTQHTYLVNSFNFFVTDPLAGSGYALKKTARSPGVEAALSGSTGSSLYVDYQGVPVMGAYAWLPDYRMAILTEIEQSEAYAPILRLIWLMSGLMVGIAVVITILAIFFARSITRPVNEVIKGTREFARGNLDYRLNIRSKDEVGLLARAFNVMTVELQATTVSRNKLEQEAEQRKKTEVLLKEISSKQEAILAAVPDIIMEVDKNKVYTWANQTGQEFFGEDVIGKEASAYFEGAQNTNDTVQPLFDGDENTSYVESWQRRKDGQKRLLGWWCRVLTDNDGNATGALSAARDITELKLSEQKIRQINEELEQRVQNRTAQLEDSNKELEAFAYSVSHDLRAPLRAIDGYTRILLEDFEPNLDDEGKRICSVIRENTHNMGNLIDDLLAFSRLSRTEINKTSIDMGIMANSIFHELTDDQNRSRIAFLVNSVPNAIGDPTMIRQVWANLLSNAIKFSSKQEQAVIIVSGQQTNNEIIYSVQDNGVGFDMQYVNKLYGVFQRLHSKGEFEGNGVGLAIVQRIVHRHGGRVWAEGEINKGAILYFTIPVRGG